MSMTAALRVVQAIVSLSFLGLGLLTVVDWLRHRERSRGYLALALATLGLTGVVGQLNTVSGYQLGQWLEDLTLVFFMTSAYGLLLFRDSFLPLGRQVRVGALVLVIASTALAVAVGIPPSLGSARTGLQDLAALALVFVWSGCVVEPIVRFWTASRGRPAVQRARLRALGGGYAAIMLILLVAGFGGTAAASVLVQWTFELIAVIALPLLLISFAPPRWLRRIWRQSEVEELSDAIHDLVLFSPDRPTLARRAGDWAMRLVGADGVAIVDTDGGMLALKGLSQDAARTLASQAGRQRAAQLLTTPGAKRPNAIAINLPLDSGRGTMIVVSGPFTPFFGTEEVLQLHGYAANVTAGLDRARVTERLAALDKMKSQFLNLASHELRSPLGIINGYLSLLEQGALGQLKESGLRAIEVLKAKTLEMNLLVAQLLDAARLEEGKLTLKRDHLDLRLIAEEALRVVRPSAGPAHELILETAAHDVPVFGDRDRLLTVLTNLLENAIKYSPHGGRVRCLVSADGQLAKLSVIDTGVGIASEDLSRLFTRFERLQNPQTTHVGGTGLGLYLSRELARQHGGEIEVDSEPGVGSTFTLVLPLTRPVPAEPPIEVAVIKETASVGPRLHVLAGEGESESRPA
jgi:signal transduction histidine kinase